MASTGERLPWLDDEPPRADRPRPVARVRHETRAMWPWYLGLLLLVVAVAAGAWWLSAGREKVQPPQLPDEQVAAVPPLPRAQVPTPGETEPTETQVDERALGRSPEAPAAADSIEPAPPRPRVAAPAERARSAEPARSPADGARRSVFPADEPAVEPPPATGPAPVVIVNPRPYRGRVVQLGAFPTRAQAEERWRSITRRYPYLATKPKMVNTVDVRGLGGSRPTRMFRLQLGTSSQAQSVVICQQLERAGVSCVVVY